MRLLAYLVQEGSFHVHLGIMKFKASSLENGMVLIFRVSLMRAVLVLRAVCASSTPCTVIRVVSVESTRGAKSPAHPQIGSSTRGSESPGQLRLVCT